MFAGGNVRVCVVYMFECNVSFGSVYVCVRMSKNVCVFVCLYVYVVYIYTVYLVLCLGVSMWNDCTRACVRVYVCLCICANGTLLLSIINV